MEPIALSVNDTKQALGLGRTKIYQLIAEGKLKAVKVGRRRLITVESIRGVIEPTKPPRLPERF